MKSKRLLPLQMRRQGFLLFEVIVALGICAIAALVQGSLHEAIIRTHQKALCRLYALDSAVNHCEQAQAHGCAVPIEHKNAHVCTSSEETFVADDDELAVFLCSRGAALRRGAHQRFWTRFSWEIPGDAPRSLVLVSGAYER